MMRTALSLPAMLLCPVVLASEPAPVQDSHQKIAEDLIQLLSETEIALNTCQDAASVQAAIPQFRKLAETAASIAARQAAIAQPTIQDDIAAAAFVEDFSVLWQAICRHINRLEKAGLITDELRDVLKLAPATPMPAAE